MPSFTNRPSRPALLRVVVGTGVSIATEAVAAAAPAMGEVGEEMRQVGAVLREGVREEEERVEVGGFPNRQEGEEKAGAGETSAVLLVGDRGGEAARVGAVVVAVIDDVHYIAVGVWNPLFCPRGRSVAVCVCGASKCARTAGDDQQYFGEHSRCLPEYV